MGNQSLQMFDPSNSIADIKEIGSKISAYHLEDDNSSFNSSMNDFQMIDERYQEEPNNIVRVKETQMEMKW